MVKTASFYDLPVQTYNRFSVRGHFFTSGGLNFEILAQLKLTGNQIT